MSVKFLPVRECDQNLLADLAYEIWNEYWPQHIGQAQTDYMIKRFQSLEAIQEQMAHDAYEYWFVTVDEADSDSPWTAPDGRPIVGFTGGHVEPETNRFFISKIYLLAAERGKHYASKVVQFYVDLCETRGLRAMYLTVNKGNELGIRAYKGKGFTVIEEAETPIGEGFIMDDYIMEKEV